MNITHAEKIRITNSEDVNSFMRSNVPVKFELNKILVVGLIGQLQLAFRHPGNNGATRIQIEKFIRELIADIDPGKGDLYKFLMMGFHEKFDE